ncbi:hypothetical protein L2E82_41962 [Cichorium intybus]|uniref:Uncharacterized protein n=1 Tax=Cichorium intybus TaxID=13427 RepID=A0ACB8ZQM6_CICIN|nr:hypothetical protein L2E82_41962 [Cichorium intybus]
MSSQLLPVASLSTTPRSSISPSSSRIQHTLAQRIHIPAHVYKHPAAILLELCTSMEELHQIIPLIIKNGLYQEHLFQTKLVSLFCKYGSLTEATRVFEPIENKNDALYHTMLKGYAQNSSIFDGLSFFCRMMEDGVQPVVYNFTYLLKGCGENALVRNGKEVHAQLILNGHQDDVYAMTSLHACADSGDLSRGQFLHQLANELNLQNDISLTNSLISMYSKCKQIEIAGKLFKNMKEKTIVSWNAMILGYAQNGRVIAALNLFRDMKLQKINPDSFTMVSIISAISESSILLQAKWIHGVVTKTFLDKNVFVKTALVDMIKSAGYVADVDSMHDVEDDVEEHMGVECKNEKVEGFKCSKPQTVVTPPAVPSSSYL